MSSETPMFRSAFTSWQDADLGMGRRPVILDILGPDWETSLLPEELKMVLHVNPSTMSFSHQKVTERIQTRGGYVEQHWGDGNTEISFEMATGGFMRLYTGLSYTTSPEVTGGTRRETIAYDKYLDLLALFHNNGAVYDSRGAIVLQGIIKITFDEGVYYGWFNSFSVQEAAEKPYQFALSAGFTVNKEQLTLRTTVSSTTATATTPDMDSGEVVVPGVNDPEVAFV